MLQYYTTEPEPQSGKPTLSISDALGDANLRREPRPNGVFAKIVGLSMVAHIALAAAFLISAACSSTGGGAVELEAISVTIITGADLQAASSAGIATATIPADPVPEAPLATANAEAVALAAEVKTPPPLDLVLPPSELNTAGLSTPPEIQAKAEPTDAPPVVDAKDDKRSEPTPPSQIGGAQSAPVSVGGNSVGQASASRGDMDRYAREVALFIGRNRPKGTGAKGRVTVDFSLSAADGSVQTLKIGTSSGNARLDSVALSVIGKATYPTPPAGMTASQLTFRVPFTFE